MPARRRALRWLQSFHFTELDLEALRADRDGGIFFVCRSGTPTGDAIVAPPEVEATELAEDAFPSELIFHSRPGAPYVLYLDFTGEVVTNTAWNDGLNRSEIPAVAFSTDTDFTTFSDAERAAIRRIWQRIAEDYAPFDVDVTTERPATFDHWTAHALITRSTDANGNANPYAYAGGVAYVNVFGTSWFASYRPAWIYYDNLANNASYVAEAASHELGHNLGLSHDGQSGGTEYYRGHGSGEVSWGPIMGTCYDRNVSQWSKGDYYLASNTEDDLATIAAKTSFRSDDCGDTPASAVPLTVSDGTNIVSTTVENDPDNIQPQNKGVLERTGDVDVFSVIAGSGPLRISVAPWTMAAGPRGGNVDVSLALFDEGGILLATNNPATGTGAVVETVVPEGKYFIHISGSGTGDPLAASPSGYVSYASVGQYFISGSLAAATTFVVAPSAVLLTKNLTEPEQASIEFAVRYEDDAAVDVTSIDSADILVVGSSGYQQFAQLVAIDASGPGSPRTATYAATPLEGGPWMPEHNGAYAVMMSTNQVADTEGAWVAAGELGAFEIAVPATYEFSATVNQPAWGSVSPSNGIYAGGTLVEVLATPATYYRFGGWDGDVSGSENPIQVSIDGHCAMRACFEEVMTEQHPTPHAWLASYGYTNDFEAAVTEEGANGMALWESYIAGLDPTDPDSRLLVREQPAYGANGIVLEWNVCSGRVYTIYATTNLMVAPVPLPDAVDLSWDTSRYTNAFEAGVLHRFHSVGVRKP